MEKVVRELHGIDVIMNVAKFIKIDKWKYIYEHKLLNFWYF
jgi:hypothetical protein